MCPQCGSAAAVHSIEELAAMARSQLGQQPGGAPQPGGPQPPGAQPGWAAEPQPGWAAEPQPGYGGPPPPGPLPGYAQEPRPGGPRGWRGRSGYGNSSMGDTFGESLGDALGDDIAGAAISAATRFIGRKIGRKMQQTFDDQVLPTLAARRDTMLRQQIAIAERHPDLRACLTDKVIFLAGGSRVLPMPNLGGNLTVEQADALVAQLRG